MPSLIAKHDHFVEANRMVYSLIFRAVCEVRGKIFAFRVIR